MSQVISKTGVHCVGDKRNGYGDFLRRIADAGRQLGVVKCRDNFGAVDEPLRYWPDVLCIGAKTEWDDRRYNAQQALTDIKAAHTANPKIHYWEYFNERNGEYQQQADLYIALLPLLKQAGLGLVMFNCATGTPQFPQDDPAPYSEVARACKFAKDGGYDALLGLHEYTRQDEPGMIGRFATLADYLESAGALIPIVISEYAFETHPGDAAFMNFITEHDAIYSADPRVRGCATWTLGGGGWQGSNYQNCLPQLGEYIATVAPFTPIVPPDPVDPPDAGETFPFVVIAHLVPQDTTSAEFDTVQAEALPLRQDVLFSADIAKSNALRGQPGSKIIVWQPDRWSADIAAYLAPAAVEVRWFDGHGDPAEPATPFWCVWPVGDDEAMNLTDAFNAPRPYANRKHEGIDCDGYINASGKLATVLAAQDGVIEMVRIRADQSYGLHVVIRHPWGNEPGRYRTLYAHLSRVDVAEGQSVTRGEPIGLAGATGTSAIHLHFNVHDAVNGLKGYVRCKDCSALFPDGVIDPIDVLRDEPAAHVTAACGLHDMGGLDWMLRNGRRGVGLDHVCVTDHPLALDYSRYADNGIQVIVRVNYGYADGTGTLPPPDRLAAFEAAAIKTMRQAIGVTCFQYGNEINNPAEWPGGFALTPQYYLASYNRVWQALPTAVKMGPSAIDPYFGPGSNNREWWVALLNGMAGADALFLHPKTQSNAPDEIESYAKFSHEPLTWQYLHFRTVETSLEVVPPRFRDLPVYLTECNPQRITAQTLGWRVGNTDWIKRCKAYIADWNAAANHQPVHGLIFYRWADDDWALCDKPDLLKEIFA